MEVSASAKDLILQILKVDPEQRLPIPEILKHAYMKSDGVGLHVGTRLRAHLMGQGMSNAVVVRVGQRDCDIVFE